MTSEPDPYEPLDPLPLDATPQRRRPTRRLDRRVVAGAVAIVVALAALAAFTGGSDEAGVPESANPTPATTPLRSVDAAPLESESGGADGGATLRPSSDGGGGGFSLFAASEAEAWIEPAGPLTDGQTVVVFAENPFLFVEEAGYAFCRVGIDDACTAIDGSGFEPGEINSMMASLPRRFTDWRGDRHDCVLDGPCELRLWALDSTIVELNVPVAFDATTEPTPVIEPEATIIELGLVTDVQLALDDAIGLSVLACTTQETVACEADPRFVGRWNPSGDRIAFTVDRLIYTPRGPHDCVLDGPCEVRFTTDDGRLIAPVPITFDPGVELERPRLTVRPAAGLADGDLVELRVDGADAGLVLFSICAPDRFFCARFDTAEAGDALIRRIPRLIEQRSATFDEGRVIDCGVEPCVIRAVAGGAAVDQPLDFDPTQPLRPQPEAGVADQRDVYEPGMNISLAVRGLLIADPSPALRTPVNVRFCEAPDAPSSQCVNAIGDGDGVGPDGRFESTVTIPFFDRRRSRISGTGERAPFCAETCWIVVTTQLATPGAAIPIDIESPTGADD